MPDGTVAQKIETPFLTFDQAMDYEVTEFELLSARSGFEVIGLGALIIKASVLDVDGNEHTVDRDQLITLFDENSVCEAEEAIFERETHQ